MLTKDYDKINISDGTSPSLFARIWKDPVGSKVISALIIGLIPTIYSMILNAFNSYSFHEWILNAFTFKIQLYWFLIFIGLSIIIFISINLYIKKKRLLPTDNIINMKIGDFKYIELVNTLNSHLLVPPISIRKSEADTISLLDCFVLYARKISDGVSVNDEGDQEQFLNQIVCPVLEVYGLVIRNKENNPNPSTNWDINFYYISENGKKFYQALQVYRMYIGETMKEW